MKKICVSFIFLFLSLFVSADNIPQPQGWVNDFAGVISSEYKEKLNSLIKELEQKTTTEITVVTIDTIVPYNEKEYSRLLFDNWKPGKKGKDNGVLVLLAIKERRWRIETGYGVEGILPDGLCGEIGRNYMVPYFKEGEYGKGLYQGVIQIVWIIAKDTGVNLSGLEDMHETLMQGPVSSDSVSPLAIFLFSSFFLFFMYTIIYSRRKGSYYNRDYPFSGGWYGGVSSGGFGGFSGGGFGGFGGGGGGGGGAGGGF